MSTDNSAVPALLARLFEEMARAGSVPWASWPADEPPERYGLTRQADRVVPLAPYDPLRPDAVRAALSSTAADWLRDLEIFAVIGSTNTHLMTRGRTGPLDGLACLAELQVQGRGRRGRDWASPFGAQLAVSLGLAVNRPPADLGGVSLVVGLAVADALEQLGVSGVALKWPNDVLLNGAKLGGILIEMVHQRGTELVVGIGLNVALPPSLRATLPQQVTDLAAAGTPPVRSLVSARVMSRVVEFVREFELRGFEPFRRVFETRHHYHGQSCVVFQGDRTIPGRVMGISDSGGLLLHTDGGVQEFHGGEVSLRPER